MKPLMFGLFVASFVFLLSSIGQAIDDESLVLYLPFNEGTGDITQDQSGNNNDGAIEGAEWTDGKIGKALYFNFDEGDSVRVADSDSLDVTSITIEAWIKSEKDMVKGSMTDAGIVHKWNPGGYLLYLENLFGSVSLYLPHTNTYVRSTTNAWKKGVWYHVAATYDEKKGEGKTYVNGKLEATEKSAGKLIPNINNLVIGRYIETFDGIIDEAALYNRVLTEEEINQDMNKGVIAAAVSPAGSLATTWAKIKNDLR